MLEEKLVKEEQKALQLAKQEETTMASQRLEQNKLEVCFIKIFLNCQRPQPFAGTKKLYSVKKCSWNGKLYYPDQTVPLGAVDLDFLLCCCLYAKRNIHDHCSVCLKMFRGKQFFL